MLRSQLDTAVVGILAMRLIDPVKNRYFLKSMSLGLTLIVTNLMYLALIPELKAVITATFETDFYNYSQSFLFGLFAVRWAIPAG